jgi:ssRNA-specific RNase YbeY (16S rRNA maturation enzyme)
MFSYNILSTPQFSINKKVIDKIFEVISNNIDKKQKGILNIVFLDDDSIKNLNKNYR